MNATAQRLILFARAPVLGRVKTRLARDIGDAAALDFYQRCLMNLLAECRQADWTTEIAVASAADINHSFFADHTTIAQIQGDLGLRMRHELMKNDEHPCLIVGSDIPNMQAQHIEEAFLALSTNDFVFGPATDGGFWCVGCRQSLSLPAGFFEMVRWSTQYALEDALQTIPKSLRVAKVTTLSDVDDGESYHRLKPFSE